MIKSDSVDWLLWYPEIPDRVHLQCVYVRGFGQINVDAAVFDDHRLNNALGIIR